MPRLVSGGKGRLVKRFLTARPGSCRPGLHHQREPRARPATLRTLESGRSVQSRRVHLWHDLRVPRPLRPWLLVVPLAALGMLGGHELAYAITRTPRGPVHDYLAHLPQVALVLLLLSVIGALFVRGSGTAALWPFPVVALAGFVVQEHGERLEHAGALPFLLDEPFFVVGLIVQCLVALVAWFVARLLLDSLSAGAPSSLRHLISSTVVIADGIALVGGLSARRQRTRAPPERR